MSRRALIVVPRAAALGAVVDSFAHLGSGGGDDPLGLRGYLLAEDALVRCLMELASAWGAEDLVVRQPYADRPLPPWLPDLRHDTRLSFGDAAALLRRMLRGGEGFGCRFGVPGGDLVVGAGGDLCLVVETRRRDEARVRSTLRPEVLVEAVHDAPTERSPALAGEPFWAAAVELADRDGRRLWFVESWAQGAYGERWYRADAAGVGQVRQRVLPHSLLTAGSVDVPAEHLTLDRICDRTTAAALDSLDLRAVPADAVDRNGPLDVLPVREATITSGRLALSQPVVLFSPRKFFVPGLLERGERVLQVIVPGPDGTSDSEWPAVGHR